MPVNVPEKEPATVFYIDDNPDDRALFAVAARQNSSFQVGTANTVAETIEYLKGDKQFGDRTKYPVPDLILVDYSLRNERGIELLRWIRKESDFATLPVIIFSGNADLHTIGACYAAGADYFVIKPKTFAGLLKVTKCLDTCLAHKPLRLRALKDLAAHPELAHNRLREDLRAGIAEHRELSQRRHQARAALDLTRAEAKERKKQIPFIRKARPNTRPPNRSR